MKTKEVAKAVKDDDIAIVTRIKEQVYWVGSIYALVKMDQDQYKSFRKKFNSYANTEKIPENIEAGQSYHNKEGSFKEDGPDITAVIDQYNEDLQTVYRTNFSYQDDDFNRILKLYSVNDTLSAYNSKYDKIIDQFNRYHAVDHRRPIRCYEGDKLKAVIMPVNLYALNNLYFEYEDLVELELPERR